MVEGEAKRSRGNSECHQDLIGHLVKVKNTSGTPSHLAGRTFGTHNRPATWHCLISRGFPADLHGFCLAGSLDPSTFCTHGRYHSHFSSPLPIPYPSSAYQAPPLASPGYNPNEYIRGNSVHIPGTSRGVHYPEACKLKGLQCKITSKGRGTLACVRVLLLHTNAIIGESVAACVCWCVVWKGVCVCERAYLSVACSGLCLYVSGVRASKFDCSSGAFAWFCRCTDIRGGGTEAWVRMLE